MYTTIGKWEPSYLLSDPQGAQVISIPCMPGNGIIQRGQIMKRGNDGMYTPAAAADITSSNHLVVVDEVVDTTADATIAADARAYRAGRMIESKLLLTDGELTADHKLVLRQQGILTDVLMEDASEFNNSTSTETE